jgi:hypothetical protein
MINMQVGDNRRCGRPDCSGSMANRPRQAKYCSPQCASAMSSQAARDRRLATDEAALGRLLIEVSRQRVVQLTDDESLEVRPYSPSRAEVLWCFRDDQRKLDHLPANRRRGGSGDSAGKAKPLPKRGPRRDTYFVTKER